MKTRCNRLWLLLASFACVFVLSALAGCRPKHGVVGRWVLNTPNTQGLSPDVAATLPTKTEILFEPGNIEEIKLWLPAQETGGVVSAPVIVDGNYGFIGDTIVQSIPSYSNPNAYSGLGFTAKRQSDSFVLVCNFHIDGDKLTFTQPGSTKKTTLEWAKDQ